MLTLIIDMALLFTALLFVKWDVNKQNFDNRIYMAWLVGTMIGYFFYWMYGAAVVFVGYLVFSRVFKYSLQEAP